MRLLLLIMAALLAGGCAANRMDYRLPVGGSPTPVAFAEADVVILEVRDSRLNKEEIGSINRPVVGTTSVVLAMPEEQLLDWWARVCVGRLRENGIEAYYEQGASRNQLVDKFRELYAAEQPLPLAAELRLSDLSLQERLSDDTFDRRKSYALNLKGRVDVFDVLNPQVVHMLHPVSGEGEDIAPAAQMPVNRTFLDRMIFTAIQQMDFPTAEELERAVRMTRAQGAQP